MDFLPTVGLAVAAAVAVGALLRERRNVRGLADSLVVLGGESPGRQWADPMPVLSVLRGAMSRIIDYRRVDLGEPPDVAVLGRAVEPVAHALAELLDNATRYSPPESRVRL